MKILFVIPYPIQRSPSQRFRFEQYFGILKQAGFQYSTDSFLNDDGWKIIYRKGHGFSKFFVLLRGLLKRLFTVFRSSSYDFVFIHREAAPVGPPVFEWLMAKVLRKKIIYDFDDAIWLTDKTSENFFARTIRWRSKVGSICKWAYRVSCGNHYLCEYARKFNSSVVFNPTTIDLNHHHLRHHETENKLIIGWTGSHTTLKYLDEVIDVLNTISEKYPNTEFHVIANQSPSQSIRNLRFIPWSEETEVTALSAFDIGIMPLPDDEWSKGKCGFKALQYMSLGIPCIASAVGANSVIIQDGKNGLLCKSREDWLTNITRLIDDRELRKRLGDGGRETVVSNYSVASNSYNFVSLFE